MSSIQRIVFCDFDGTITKGDSFVEMFKHFAPEGFARIKQEILAQRLSIREAACRLVESIPSIKYSEILNFVRTQELRAGFAEFLDFLETEGVPFVIISGGLRDLVVTCLGPLTERIQAIHAAEVDAQGDYLRIFSDYQGETELVEKVTVMALYNFEESVAIGNGMTDQKMAVNSSIIFARDGLADYLDKAGRAYESWDNFLEIRDCLAERWRCLQA